MLGGETTAGRAAQVPRKESAFRCFVQFAGMRILFGRQQRRKADQHAESPVVFTLDRSRLRVSESGTGKPALLCNLTANSPHISSISRSVHVETQRWRGIRGMESWQFGVFAK